MFKKNDYIVTLKHSITNTECAKENYCFKQRMNEDYICPIIDLSGYSSNSNSLLTFDKEECLLDWRYATEREIIEYNRIGKPYDVTTISEKIYELWN